MKVLFRSDHLHSKLSCSKMELAHIRNDSTTNSFYYYNQSEKYVITRRGSRYDLILRSQGPYIFRHFCEIGSELNYGVILKY